MKKNASVLKNALMQSRDFIKCVVVDGDIAIDATAGNGHDTLMLADLVGENGKVYSFDIQAQALENTYGKLVENDLEKRVVLINDGHENMDDYVKEPVKAVIFNLGYLPGGDHRIATSAETTIKAIQHAMALLLCQGLISIVIYHGGDSGYEEKEKVLAFLQGIDCKAYTIMKIEYINQENCPPIWICIEKKQTKKQKDLGILYK